MVKWTEVRIAVVGIRADGKEDELGGATISPTHGGDIEPSVELVERIAHGLAYLANGFGVGAVALRQGMSPNKAMRQAGFPVSGPD